MDNKSDNPLDMDFVPFAFWAHKKLKAGEVNQAQFNNAMVKWARKNYIPFKPNNVLDNVVEVFGVGK